MITANQNKNPAIGAEKNTAIRFEDSQSNNLNQMMSIMTGENSSDLELLN